MAGEMQPGEYESAYTGYAARHPRRALRPTARESCGGGARGARRGKGQVQVGESRGLDTDVRSMFAMFYYD